MNRFARTLLGLIAAALPLAVGAAEPPATIEQHFANPPQSAGIRCWWWWLNGNVTKAAITRDLEQMRAKGFSGACIFDAGGAEQRGNDQVPEGPMFGSPEWRELFQHAVREADRLGLVLSLNIQSGWNLGGPTVTPAEATKHVTWSETRISGPAAVKQQLPEPKTRDGFYKDIAVLAVPVGLGRQANLSKRAPIRNLVDKAVFHEVGGSAPDTRHLLTDVPASPGEEDARLADVVNLTGKLNADGTLDWQAPAGEWRVFRFGYTCSGARVSTSSGQWQGRVIDHLSAEVFRAYWNRHVEPLLQDIGPLAGKTLKYLQTDSWELGGVNWTDNFAAEFKKRRGYDVLPYLPVLAGQILESRDVCNRFLADFRKTIGDLVSDNHYRVFAELARRHGIGLAPESAGPHAGPFDGLKNYGHSELMMSEFWAPSPHRPRPENRFFVKQASSAAHIYNKTLVGAESFTTIGPHWNDTLWSAQKPAFNHEICSGLNLVLLHTFTCSPPEMGLPGQEYFAGTHFNPQVTWWELSDGFIRYMSRVQVLMQQGRFVADALYYYGDHVPNIARLKEDDPAQVLPGYDYDVINEDRLLALEVKEGRLTLPHGMSYRVLVLPDHGVLSLAALRKVHALVTGGATIIGPKTQRIVSLEHYPACDAELRKLADDLWGKGGEASGERTAGRGRVVWGRTAREVLRADGVRPDFEVLGYTPKVPPTGAGKWVIPDYDYIHHTLDGMDYYFVCSHAAEPRRIEAAFRVTGKQPELWDPVTGDRWPAQVWRQELGRTFLPLEFGPNGALFVVFRQPVAETQKGGGRSNFPVFNPVLEVAGPWQVRFDPKWGGPGEVAFDKLVSWTARPEPGIKYYSGTATYSITFDCPAPAGKALWLDLGDLRDVGMARVRLNGQDCGIAWTPPFRVDISRAVKAAGNALEVVVVNSWRNRLLGDRDLPPDKRFTKTNIRVKPDWQLVESGLLGPVKVMAVTPP